MLYSGGTRIPFLWVLPTCLWGAQSVFETWGRECEEEEGLSSPNSATRKASGDALCQRHHSSFSWNPGHDVVYFGARAPGGSPLVYPIGGPIDAYPHAPIMGFVGMVCWSCWATLPGSSSCCPLPAVSHYQKMDIEFIFPKPFKHLHKSPSSAGSWCSC